MAKYNVRKHFSVQLPDGSVVLGPAEVELDEKQYQLEKHKLEEFAPEAPAPSDDDDENSPQKSLSKMNKAELEALAQEKGLFVEGMTKAEIIEALEAE